MPLRQCLARLASRLRASISATIKLRADGALARPQLRHVCGSYYARFAVSVPLENPQAETLAATVGAYLGATVERLCVLASGWETTLYEFALETRSELLPGAEPGTPLVLRLYPSAEAAQKGAHEYRTISYLRGEGYPVPQPYLFEPGTEAIGAPFLVMERLSGEPLFAVRSFPQAFKTFSMGFLGFVRAQARLHRMTLPPPEVMGMATAPASSETHASDCAQGAAAAASSSADSAAGLLLEHTLDTVAARVEDGPLPGLAEPLAYLRARAGEFRHAPPSFLHLDYHPQNVLVKGLRVTGVIDWANTAAGDRHFDAATTSVILSTSAMEHPRWMRENIAGNSLRRNFYMLYIAIYQAIAPLEFKRLRYYQGLAGAARLSMLGMMRVRGPESVGFRPGAISEVTPSVLRLLSRYVARKTGTHVPVP
jgi:aminoglycoside phosphotransferase (APT) family kinase protein